MPKLKISADAEMPQQYRGRGRQKARHRRLGVASQSTSQTYTFNFGFRLPGNVASIPLKALFAGKVSVAGQTFYPPLLPCETNFANIPVITLTQSAAFQNVSLPSPTNRGCVNKVYAFASGGIAAPAVAVTDIPTLTTWGIGLLAILTSLYGAIRLRRRQR